jgi:hypothetical protein
VLKWAQENIGSVAMEVPENWGDGRSINIGDTNPHDFRKATVAFDFGVVYRTGFRSLNIAMRARNFSRDLEYERNPFELPLTFQIGASMNLMDFTHLDPSLHAFALSVDAERHRDYPEQLRLGGEYIFMNTIALRAGYAYPTDQQGVNLGVGLQADVRGIAFGADYAYIPFGLFGGVNQLGLRLGF